MTNARFDNLMETMNNHAASCLANLPSTLTNFADAAEMSGRTPAQVAWTSMLSPLVCLRKMVMADTFNNIDYLRDTCAEVIHYITYIWCLGREDHTAGEQLLKDSIGVLMAKNANYSTDGDRLHNFHVGAKMVGGTPAQAAWGYVVKHLVSLQDKVDSNNFSNVEDFAEKCTDIINYTALIWCLANENAPVAVVESPKEEVIPGFAETIAETVDAVQSSNISGFTAIR